MSQQDVYSKSSFRGGEETISFGNQTCAVPTVDYSSSSLFSDNEGDQMIIFAPPGKIGVAIDVIQGHPIVHKIKRGSPVEGLLQPNDMVLAIDDVGTTCMSAADVTHLMVKRMNYQRKITILRR